MILLLSRGNTLKLYVRNNVAPILNVSEFFMDNNPNSFVFNEANSLQALAAAVTAETTVAGEIVSTEEKVNRFSKLVKAGGVRTCKDILPAIFQLNGEAYSLEDHFPFEDIYRLSMAPAQVWRTGRQVAKTTNMATFGITACVSIPNFKILYITPLFEQIRRFSAMYIQPFINNSPVKHYWLNQDSVKSVLHRTFANGSSMLFSFALLDADRVRGISADLNWIDELQDMNREHLPIIRETMSHSSWELRRETGTPKTLDNVLEGRWNESSQAEWFIPCTHCTTGGNSTMNIPSMDFHLEKMLGPWHEGISEKTPAIICYKCSKPINPRQGFWKHRWPERMFDFAGYHIPQIIMPLHYSRPDKWAVILAKREGRGNTPINVFYNEVLGEGYDVAAKIVSLTELKQACTDRPNTIEFAASSINNYALRILAVDWGGGGRGRGRSGATSVSLSLTTVALLGLRHDGRIDVLYGERLLTPHDHLLEARKIKDLWDRFRPSILAHDYSGAGQLRETFLIQAGVPQGSTMPMQYVRSASSAPCYHVPATPGHPRSHYRVDKARMLLLTCAYIRLHRLKFFKYDHVNQDNAGLVHDFLALIEENVETSSVRPIYKISCAEGSIDDFAQAVAMGCIAIWHRSGSWPNLSELSNIALTPEQVEAAGYSGMDVIPEY